MGSFLSSQGKPDTGTYTGTGTGTTWFGSTTTTPSLGIYGQQSGGRKRKSKVNKKTNHKTKRKRR
jgi:hypothetical protein